MPNNPTKIHVRQIKQLISSSEVDLLFSGAIINPSHIVGGASVTPTNFSSLDTTTSIQQQLNSKLGSSAISNSPTWIETSIAPSAAAVKAEIGTEIANAFINNPTFKGSWSTHPTGTNMIQAGWSYVYDSTTSEDPSGITLEVGDYLVAKIPMNSISAKQSASNWVIVQANLTGAVTAGTDLTLNHLIVGNGGKTITNYNNTTAGIVTINTNGIVEIDSNTYSRADHTHTLNLKIGSTTYAISISGNLTIGAANGGSWAYDGSTLVYTAPSITITNGAAETNKYISSLTSSGQTVTCIKNTLPTAPTIIREQNLTVVVGSTTSTITLSHTPNSFCVLFLNGQLLTTDIDYSISNNIITLITYTTIEDGDIWSALYNY